ncbi:hypothetical protein SAMN06296241_0218 [Salinimicrobium sediminis]|uniref:PAP2 superfamily protein n=1 Tax=Salinimicrobium sediminis TaxID=1343891 RepID=A0A285X047_9FLAO|nr:vanadium-dependent haloperoxidase [Salinimicrobium sediminis]SOC78705.1 hypothetical protein SAMN06296241_0218 [Salinimicrobium sediminis]
MKRIQCYLVLITSCLLLTTSCSKDENTLNENETAVLSFGPVLNDFTANSTAKQALEDLPECTNDDPAYVMIILSQDGAAIVGTEASPFRVNLAPNQDFTMEVPELELSPGQYTLEYFAVHNAAGDLIWVAPAEGAFLNFVDDPLPMTIDLAAGVKKYVEVDVLCFDDRFVNEYGYLFFDLSPTEVIDFCIFGNYCDDTGRHYPAVFSVDVWRYINGAPGAQIYSNLTNDVALNSDGDYAGSTVCMALPDTAGEDEYYFEISLLNSDAYGEITEEVIRSGVITDEDVRDLFVGGEANDYYHFREGCGGEDAPDLFDDDRVTEAYSSEAVLRWNELVAASINQEIPQPLEVKAYAMITLAIHDALNNVVPKYETYALDNSEVDAAGITSENIHVIADAAVSQAARDMLVQLYPPATAAADELLSTMLAGIPDSDLKTEGIKIGKAAAAAVLAKRSGDIALWWSSYSGGTAPGEYQANYMPWMVATGPWPNNAVFGANMGELTPFGIESSDQFMDEGPYPLNSAEYIADYNETKMLGCNSCPARTAEQTEIGLFWLQTSSGMLNKITRDLIAQKDLDGWEAAKLIALIQMATIDAYIASFEEKFHFDFWRPITAIRAGDSDGVEATAGDVNWTTFSAVPTPPNPQFPSSHSYAAGAAAEIYEAYFGTDQVNLTITSQTLPGVERQMTSFSQIAHEKGIYGLYIGYDFRQAIEVGEENGRELGDYLFENALTELD